MAVEAVPVSRTTLKRLRNEARFYTQSSSRHIFVVPVETYHDVIGIEKAETPAHAGHAFRIESVVRRHGGFPSEEDAPLIVTVEE